MGTRRAKAKGKSGIRFRLWRHVNTCSWTLALLLSTLSGLAPIAARSQTVSITQHRINEVAASLERAHHILIEDVGKRLSGEPLPSYLTRLTAPLPAETPAQRKARVDSYITALAQAATQSASLRRMPALNDTSAGNRVLWQRAVQALNELPGCVSKLRVAWRHDQEKPPVKPGAQEKPSEAFIPLLSRAVWLVTTALGNLRDAQP